MLTYKRLAVTRPANKGLTTKGLAGGRLATGRLATGWLATGWLATKWPKRAPCATPVATPLVMALAMALLLVSGLFAPQSRAQDFVSTRAAFEQGIQAYRAEYYEIAIPALKYAGERGDLLAKFYLARIYADANAAQTNHGKAYRLYYQIVRDNLAIDADIDPRALYVAKSLTALAGYVRRGLPAISLRANPRKAAVYLRQSADHFDDTDAQFELAKLLLTGEGVRKNVALARHILSVLTTQKAHAPAQAFLAQMLWEGRYIKQNRAKALALITVAVANAPDHERVWIDDIYANIYCDTSIGIRKQAGGFVAGWRNRYAGKILRPNSPRVTDLPLATRTCDNGEAVEPVESSDIDRWLRENPAAGAQSVERTLPRKSSGPRTLRGNMGGFSIRDIGASGTGR